MTDIFVDDTFLLLEVQNIVETHRKHYYFGLATPKCNNVTDDRTIKVSGAELRALNHAICYQHTIWRVDTY